MSHARGIVWAPTDRRSTGSPVFPPYLKEIYVWPWTNNTDDLLRQIRSQQSSILLNQSRLLGDNHYLANRIQEVEDALQLSIRLQTITLQRQMRENTARLRAEIREDLDERFREMEILLFDLLYNGRPGPVEIVITGENEMADKIQFNVILPSRSAPDVVKREVSVQIDGGEPQVQELEKSVLLVTGLEGPQDSTVIVSLVDIDDAGNRSSASTSTLTLVDNVAPPQPGQIGIEIVGETHEADPTTTEEPVATTEAPEATTTEEAATTAAPEATTTEEVTTTEAPVNTTMAPEVTTTEGPVATTEEPVTATTTSSPFFNG